MDLIFVEDKQGSAERLLHAAMVSGHRVQKQIEIQDTIGDYAAAICPDALILVSESMHEAVLRQMQNVCRSRPTPMLVFTSDTRQTSINAAVKAGASAYVVDCDVPDRLDALLNVACVRFREQLRVDRELKKIKTALQDRKIVERAKGIIMRQKRVSEDQAYRSMQKLAMDRNKRMGEIAEQIIAASEILV
jgi:response regulator NasT